MHIWKKIRLNSIIRLLINMPLQNSKNYVAARTINLDFLVQNSFSVWGGDQRHQDFPNFTNYIPSWDMYGRYSMLPRWFGCYIFLSGRFWQIGISNLYFTSTCTPTLLRKGGLDSGFVLWFIRVNYCLVKRHTKCCLKPELSKARH